MREQRYWIWYLELEMVFLVLCFYDIALSYFVFGVAGWCWKVAITRFLGLAPRHRNQSEKLFVANKRGNSYRNANQGSF